jgi:glycosyltransferase involved in cell wall biosynthesis
MLKEGTSSLRDGDSVIGILFPEQARANIVRKGPTSFSDQLQLFIAKKLFPNNLSVRGNLVAIDYLTEALLLHGTMSRYELFVEPSFVKDAEALYSFGEDQSHTGRIRVTSTLQIPQGVDKYGLTGFFNPTGNFPQSLVIRNSFATHLYPVSILTHGFSLHTMLFDGFLRLLLEGTYPCDSLICTSRASRTALTNILGHLAERFNRHFRADLKYEGRLDLIPLCVDTDKLKPQDKAPLRKRLKLPADATISLYMGHVSPLKADLLPLLQVFRRLVGNNPGRQLLLVIAGTADAVYVRTLQQQILHLGLSRQVRLMDSFSDKTKPDLIGAADIFVSPGDSLQESFGLTPIEAMACGIPQVVADWDGYRDTVSHGETGFLVPTYWTRCDSDLEYTGTLLGWEFDHLAMGQSVAMDVEAFQSYLQLLIENEPLRQRLSNNSRQRALDLYSFPVVVKCYERLWSEQSFLASRMEPSKTGINFERPHYFECFQSHASSLITDDSAFELTAWGRDLDDKTLESLIHSRMSACQAINLDLVRAARDAIRGPCNSSGHGGVRTESISLGELIPLLAGEQPFHPDYVRRHVMWLMKQGIAKPQPVAPCEAERKDRGTSDYRAGRNVTAGGGSEQFA